MDIQEMQKRQVKRELLQIYRDYSAALRFSVIDGYDEAIAHAKKYNELLKSIGGPKENKGEYYLTMGKSLKSDLVEKMLIRKGLK